MLPTSRRDLERLINAAIDDIRKLAANVRVIGLASPKHHLVFLEVQRYTAETGQLRRRWLVSHGDLVELALTAAVLVVSLKLSCTCNF